MVRSKICGIKTVEDALHAAAIGADAIGLVFYAKSPRNVSIDVAAEIVQALPPFVTTVGLFMNPEQNFVEEVLSEVPLDVLQFHGSETPGFCRQFPRPYLKALGVKGNEGLQQAFEDYGDAQGFLLDSHAPGEAGGSGETFDWNSFPKNSKKPLILAGGLTPENVEDAILLARPYGVDVSSGVESARGVKDHSKMAAFIQGVKRVK